MSPLKYILASTAGAAFTAIVGFLVYKWRARVDVQTKADTSRIDLHVREETMNMQVKQAAIDAQAIPIQLLKDELAKREAELSALREQDSAERAQYVKTLTAMQTALEAIAKDLTAHREEERTRAQSVYAQLDSVDRRISIIEDRQGRTSPASKLPAPEAP